MSTWSRRKWLAGCGAAAAAQRTWGQQQPKGKPLDITEFQPDSMLQVPEHPVQRARFPVIDIHTHLSFSAKGQNGVPLAAERNFRATPEELLPIMDRKNVQMLVNLTGGYGAGLREAIQRFDKKHPGRFLTFTEPMWAQTAESGYPKRQADEVQQAHRDGARGLKILKVLGLFLRENVTSGKLVRIDDPRFDPMWEACGALNMPVAIHVSDPIAFFQPIDPHNERFEELNNHPDWSFYGKDHPSNAELLAARDRVIARHPKTQFIVLHVGNFAENLKHVSERLDRFPNFHVEMAARLGELGRQPSTSRQFFEKYQDRILFGTDAVPQGYQTPQQVYGDELYELYYRFLETKDEYFNYAPARIPPQGRWRIYGIGLPEGILKKVYHDNAAKLLRLG